MIEKQKFFNDLKTLISFKSKQSSPSPNAPFGEECKKALDFFLSVAKDMGFETTDYDGYLGEATYGSGEEFGIIGHLDVVPEGTGWDSDPYTLTEKDGKLYARGVIDNKAPTLICLYALYALKQEGVKFNKKVRFFAGCNEESGWKDVEYFLKNGNKFPEWGFSPDGDFPVVYAEKGPNSIIFEYPYQGKFKNFKGGSVVNAVCDYAEIEGVIDQDLLKKHGLTNNGNLIISKGKAAHGSMPELGKNAILPILEYMSDLGEDVSPLIDYLFKDVLGITKIGNETGKATLSPDLVKQEDGKIILTADFRVPAKMLAEDFYPYFDKTGLKYTFKKSRNPHYVPANSPVIQKLLKAYNEVTGESAEPMSQCGATFASTFKYGAAFGPEFPGVKATIHEPNEYMFIDDIEKLYSIYYQGLKAIVEE